MEVSALTSILLLLIKLSKTHTYCNSPENVKRDYNTVEKVYYIANYSVEKVCYITNYPVEKVYYKVDYSVEKV